MFKNTFFYKTPPVAIFLNKLPQTVHVLFNESKKSVLCKGIFTLFVDDNIKKSSSSVEANNNFPWDSYVYYKVSHFRTFWLKASKRKIIN